MDRERIDRWCERGIFALTLFILVFAPLAMGAVRSSEFVYVQGATLVIALLWLIRCWAKPVFEFFWPPICWPVLVFILYAIARYFTSDLEYISRLELIKICVYGTLFFAIVNNLHRQEYIQIIVWIVIALAAVMSVYGLFQFGTHSPHVWHFTKPAQYFHRGSGTLINPNHFAGYLEIILPIGLAMVLLGRAGHVTKIVLTYACALILIGIGISLSRGGWISTILMLLCFFIMFFIRARSRWVLLAGLLVAFTATAFYLSSSVQFQNRFERTFVSGKVEDPRFDYWQPTIRIWKTEPWLGVGPGHFDERFFKYRPPQVQGRPKFAHNDYLNTLADWGIVGLVIVIAFVGLFYVTVFQASKYLRRKVESGEGKSNRAALVFGVAFGVLALLLHSVTDFNMQIPGNAITLIAFAALAATQLRYSEKFWIENRNITIPIAAILCVASVGFLGFYGVRKVRENYWLQRAQSAKTLPDQVAAYEHAIAIEPNNFNTMNTLGETLRLASFRGETGYEKLAEQAITWFKRAADVNPYNPYNFLGLGMCLDWLGKTDEAGPYFTKALEVDPNSYYVLSYQGWHLVQKGDYAGAEQWFNRSLNLAYNPMSLNYREIVHEKLATQAAGKR